MTRILAKGNPEIPSLEAQFRILLLTLHPSKKQHQLRFEIYGKKMTTPLWLIDRTNKNRLKLFLSLQLLKQYLLI